MVSKFKKLLSRYRKFLFSNYRGHVLSAIICSEIERLEKLNKKKVIKILDFGSGFNPIIINKIVKKLAHKYKNTKFLAYCYDFYTKKELKIMNINSNIKFFNINSLQFQSIQIKEYHICNYDVHK